MVPAAPWVFRMAMSNCPGMQGMGGVAVGVGVGAGVAVGVATAVAIGVIGGPPLDAGVAEPQAASRLTPATSRVDSRTRRIATQGTRNPGATRITRRWGRPDPPAARARKDRPPTRPAPQSLRWSSDRVE